MPEVRLVAEAADAGAGAGAEGDVPLDRGTHETGEKGRRVGEWIGGHSVVFRLELVPGEQDGGLAVNTGHGDDLVQETVLLGPTGGVIPLALHGVLPKARSRHGLLLRGGVGNRDF